MLVANIIGAKYTCYIIIAPVVFDFSTMKYSTCILCKMPLEFEGSRNMDSSPRLTISQAVPTHSTGPSRQLTICLCCSIMNQNRVTCPLKTWSNNDTTKGFAIVNMTVCKTNIQTTVASNACQKSSAR